MDQRGELNGINVMNSKEQVKADDQSHYAANLEAHRPGISTEKMVEAYNQWAQKGTYEEDLNEERYRGPLIAAETIAQWIQNKESQILDVAAGTGFVAEKLQERGYTNIDALEPSEEMLSIAKSKNIYKTCFTYLISSEPSDIAPGSYDVTVIAGGMGEGHIPCDGLYELIRITKPGGYVIIVMRQEYLKYVNEYKDRLVPLMKQLETEGRWTCMQEKIIPFYSFHKPGISFVFKVVHNS